MAQILNAGGSEILIDRGLADLLPTRDDRDRAVVLCQPSVVSLAQRIAADLAADGHDGNLKVLPDGDDAKRLDVVEAVYRWCNELAITRFDTIVAVGGGALTDVAGFVAATYLRGVESVYVPTTVLGAVDAAIGGKTGINLDGKNLVGAFHMPSRVVIDLDVLDALPDRLKREGAAEAVKAGLIKAPDLVDLYESAGLEAPLDVVVPRAVAIKAEIVSGDVREHGERALLNYGHTIGHALEIVCGLRHGDAVAIGMVAAGRASALELGFEDEARQRRILETIGLPVVAPEFNDDDVLRLVGLDKKRRGADVHMTLLHRIGAATVHRVSSATLTAALEAVRASQP